jgi:hypothetical protein
VSGSWVTGHTGATLEVDPGVAELALRRNPKRAHLLVSLLLGKHVPVPAGTVLGAAAELGTLVRATVGPAGPYVLGFAETATALGHGVAASCDAGGYAHTTRRPAPAGATAVHFSEEHSHAVEQALAVLDDTGLRDPQRPVVLVDDELSSGRTAVNAIRVLQACWPREHYVLATLLDVRSPQQRDATAAAVAELGARLSDVSLVQGRVHLPEDLAARAAELAALPAPTRPLDVAAPVHRWSLELPADTPLTGACGWDGAAESGLRTSTGLLADALRPCVTGRVLVLGDEEFMYAAQLTAAALDASTSSTTRSPAVVVDEPGYPLRSLLQFPSSDDPDRRAFAYNVAPSRHPDPGRAPGFDSVVVLADRALHPELVRALAGAARVDVHVVQVVPGSGARVSRPT